MAESADQMSRDLQDGANLGRSLASKGGRNYMNQLALRQMKTGIPWRLLFKGILKKASAKILILFGPLILVIFLIICLIAVLPAIVTNQLFGLNQTLDEAEPTMTVNEIYEQYDAEIEGVVQNAYQAAQDRVGELITYYVNEQGYDRALSEASTIDSTGGYTAGYNTAYILACYSVMKENQNAAVSDEEFLDLLNSSAASMFPITATTLETQRYTATAIPTYSRVQNLLIVSGAITTPAGGTSYRTTTTSNYYMRNGTITITEPTDRPVYEAVSLNVPNITSGAATTSYTTRTYYRHTGRWQTVYPDIIDVKYLQCTISSFNSAAIEDAFGIDRDAPYRDTEQTVGEAIDAMADALTKTLFGSHSSNYTGSVGTLEGDAAYVAQYLLGLGFSQASTAAVLGNIKAECGWNYSTIGVLDGMFNYAYERNIGIFQFTTTTANQNSGDEYWGFMRWCAANALDYGSLDAQLRWAFSNEPGTSYWTTRWHERGRYYSGAPGFTEEIYSNRNTTPDSFMAETNVAYATYSWMAYYEGCAGGTASHFNNRLAYAQEYYAALTTLATTNVTSETQQRIVDACYSVPSPGGGLCAKWVSQVYQRAGFGYLGGNACDQYAAYCTSEDRAELQPGMIIAVPHSGSRYVSYTYGHVGIYIGNNLVMHNTGSIQTTDLDEWIETYSYQCTARWGFPDVVLS